MSRADDFGVPMAVDVDIGNDKYDPEAQASVPVAEEGHEFIPQVPIIQVEQKPLKLVIDKNDKHVEADTAGMLACFVVSSLAAFFTLLFYFLDSNPDSDFNKRIKIGFICSSVCACCCCIGYFGNLFPTPEEFSDSAFWVDPNDAERLVKELRDSPGHVVGKFCCTCNLKQTSGKQKVFENRVSRDFLTWIPRWEDFRIRTPRLNNKKILKLNLGNEVGIVDEETERVLSLSKAEFVRGHEKKCRDTFTWHYIVTDLNLDFVLVDVLKSNPKGCYNSTCYKCSAVGLCVGCFICYFESKTDEIDFPATKIVSVLPRNEILERFPDLDNRARGNNEIAI